MKSFIIILRKRKKETYNKMEIIDPENSPYMEISKTKGEYKKRTEDFEENMDKYITLLFYSRTGEYYCHSHPLHGPIKLTEKKLERIEMSDKNWSLKLANKQRYPYNFQDQCAAMFNILAYVNTQLDLVFHFNPDCLKYRISYLLYEKFKKSKSMVIELANMEVVSKKFEKKFSRMVEKYSRSYLTYVYWKSGINSIVSRLPNDMIPRILEYL